MVIHGYVYSHHKFAMEQKPNSMRGSLGGSTAEEFTVFNDNSVLDAESSDVHYFSTHVGVKIRGVDRFGIIHGVGAKILLPHNFII